MVKYWSNLSLAVSGLKLGAPISSFWSEILNIGYFKSEYPPDF